MGTRERPTSRTSLNVPPDRVRPLLPGAAAADVERLDSDGHPRQLSELVDGDPTGAAT